MILSCSCSPLPAFLCQLLVVQSWVALNARYASCGGPPQSTQGPWMAFRVKEGVSVYNLYERMNQNILLFKKRGEKKQRKSKLQESGKLAFSKFGVSK